MQTLADLFGAAPGDKTAVILPEAGLKISFDNLREQVMTMAGTLKALGIARGDRVATVLTNGTASDREFSGVVDCGNGCAAESWISPR